MKGGRFNTMVRVDSKRKGKRNRKPQIDKNTETKVKSSQEVLPFRIFIQKLDSTN